MRRSIAVLATAVVLATLPAGANRAPLQGASAPVYGAEAAEGDRWFVQLASPPAVRGTPAATLRAEKDAFRRAARAAGIAHRERFAFDALWNGFSIEASPRNVRRLAQVRGVTAIWPVIEIPLPETTAIQPELATALAMTGANTAQQSGYDGRGVKVAIMDSGIDYSHPDLGGCFGPGCRVAGGWDFVGDAYTGSGDPVEGPDPMDCNGHGTHVAGIVGARAASPSGSTGVAPAVTFSAYKVFGCTGGTRADIMMRAMEHTLADGNHILNMSIGGAYQWPQYPTATASDNLVTQGVVVVASTGNNGRNGVFSSGAPGVGALVTGVASFDNTHLSGLSFTVNSPGDGRRVMYLSLRTTDAAPTSGISAPIVHVGRGCADDVYLANASGQTALIERGGCPFAEKYDRAVQQGAVAVLVYNSEPGLFAGGGVTGAAGVPGVTISGADGRYLAGLSGVTATWTDVVVSTVLTTAGQISAFSSYGLSPDLALKPDVGAPGGLIRAPYPLAKGSYAVLSGTSMSAPHVAGAAALLLQDRAVSAVAVRDLLQSTATPQDRAGTPEGFDNVHRQGAGLVNIPALLAATTRVTPAKLSLGESEAGPATRTITIENRGAAAVTYELGFQPALSTTGSTFAPSFSQASAVVQFSARSVTVPEGESRRVQVTIAPDPALPDRSLYGGWIVLTPTTSGQSYRVAFGGFKGDYQSLPYLGDAGVALPQLATGAAAEDRVASLSVRHSGVTRPVVHLHVSHQAQSLRLEVLSRQGQFLGNGFRRDLMPRNGTASAYFAVPWDLTLDGRPIPPGEYRLRVFVLKALGQETVPGHVERVDVPGTISVEP